ncbi:MAG: dihydroorotate dehydrogenase electron transfer subunit [Actinomycetota bacterium]
MSATFAEATVADTRVVGVERIGEYQVLTLRAPQIARRTVPGQFVMLTAGALLRRAFSVFRAEDDSIAVAFDVIGGGTRWLASRALGDAVSIAGPLGTGFTMDPGGPLLAVGGGYGAAPLFLLARRMRPAGTPVHAILGAARSSRVFGREQAEAAFDSVAFTTDDGSLGTDGSVIDVLAAVVASTGATRIAACGPMPMLEAVSHRAVELGIPCEVAVEEFMACGIGVCWTCVLPVANGNGEPRYERSCTEGPVFDGAKVAWG